MCRILGTGFVACAIFALFSGCGDPATATVSGTITYQGQPLNSGRVYFHVGDCGTVRSAEIGSDGSYSVDGLPSGDGRVAVMVPPSAAAVPEDASAPLVESAGVEPVAIPERYARVETSGLGVVIQSGGQAHDIDLD